MKQRSRLWRIRTGAARVVGIVTLVAWAVLALAVLAGWVQSTRLGIVARRDSFGRTLVEQTTGLFYVDSTQGRFGVGVERSWERNGYSLALSRLLGGPIHSVHWQRLDVPITSFGAAVLGIDPPTPSPAGTGPAWTYPPSPKALGTGLVGAPGAGPEPLARRLGFAYAWESEATPGRAWSYKRAVIMPYWAVVAVVALPYPIMLRRYLRRRRSRKRLAAGCCVRCGYDVRVTTSGRCPECGAELAAGTR